MIDPLAVEREELLSAIEQLERLCAGLRNEKAGVSVYWTSELQRLRRQVERAQSPNKLRTAWTVAEKLLKAVAAELVRILIETLNYLIAAKNLRRNSYVGWRMHQIFAYSRWSDATGVSG